MHVHISTLYFLQMVQIQVQSSQLDNLAAELSLTKSELLHTTEVQYLSIIIVTHAIPIQFLSLQELERLRFQTEEERKKNVELEVKRSDFFISSS